MTDLEKLADEYAIKVAEKNVMPKDGFAEHLIKQAYLDAIKAETALLSQHILDLQKDKGNLTDKVRELEQQIEKMKCCENCKHSNTTCECYTICTIGHYDDCKSNTVLDSLDKKDYWEN